MQVEEAVDLIQIQVHLLLHQEEQAEVVPEDHIQEIKQEEMLKQAQVEEVVEALVEPTSPLMVVMVDRVS
jgi:ketol-acid reductoisomerase|tara:strand:- start:196 stop:405 length:210 start_codon:yes stop_codon:yes gene_type:complete